MAYLTGLFDEFFIQNITFVIYDSVGIVGWKYVAYTIPDTYMIMHIFSFFSVW